MTVGLAECTKNHVPTVMAWYNPRYKIWEYAVVCTHDGECGGELRRSVDIAVREWNCKHGGQMHMVQLAVM